MNMDTTSDRPRSNGHEPPPRLEGTRPFGGDDDDGPGQIKADKAEKIRAKAEQVQFRSLVEHAQTPVDASQTLLGDRWLCKGGAAFVVAPSGVGKSSAVEGEMAVKWACGKPAFGIRPARALKILIVQSENDQGDTTEMLRDVIGVLSPEDKALVAANTWCSEPVGGLAALSFVTALGIWIDEYKPDLVIIDPFGGFLGGDVSDPNVMVPFLRQWLVPLLQRKGVGCIIVHHTPKMRGWDTSKWRAVDWGYIGAGNAEQTNVARAILVIDATDTPGVYRFIATKRRQHIGWWREIGEESEDEEPPPGEWWIKYYQHAAKGIAWEEADPETAKRTEAKAKARMRRQKDKGKYPLPTVFLPLLKAEAGLTCRELHRQLKRGGSDITENLVWRRLSKAESEGLVEMDKSDRYTLTEAGMDLFA